MSTLVDWEREQQLEERLRVAEAVRDDARTASQRDLNAKRDMLELTDDELLVLCYGASSATPRRSTVFHTKANRS